MRVLLSSLLLFLFSSTLCLFGGVDAAHNVERHRSIRAGGGPRRIPENSLIKRDFLLGTLLDDTIRGLLEAGQAVDAISLAALEAQIAAEKIILEAAGAFVPDCNILLPSCLIQWLHLPLIGSSSSSSTASAASTGGRNVTSTPTRSASTSTSTASRNTTTTASARTSTRSGNGGPTVTLFPTITVSGASPSLISTTIRVTRTISGSVIPTNTIIFLTTTGIGGTTISFSETLEPPTPTGTGGNPPTGTGGSTPTDTGGNTPTGTGGNTPTGTGGNTPTGTGGNTPTGTGNPTPTGTGGNTPTGTGGETPTGTGGSTPTGTGGNTPTGTGNPTPTGTGGETPTGTGGNTPTGTGNPTPTGTGGETPTGTGGNTPTGTGNPTPTGTGGETPTGTGGNTPTGTGNNTPTGTGNNTPTGTGNNTPTGTVNNTPTDTGNNTPTGTPSPTGTMAPINSQSSLPQGGTTSVPGQSQSDSASGIVPTGTGPVLSVVNSASVGSAASVMQPTTAAEIPTSSAPGQSQSAVAFSISSLAIDSIASMTPTVTTLTNPDEAPTSIATATMSSASATGTQLSLPTIIFTSPPLDTSNPLLKSNYTRIALKFDETLNWKYVATMNTAQQELFTYTPVPIMDAVNITSDQIKTYALMQLVTSQYTSSGDPQDLATLFLAYVPNEIVSSLAAQVPTRSSPFYTVPTGVAQDLATHIDPTYPLVDSSGSGGSGGGSSGSGGGSGSNGNSSGGLSKGDKAAIGVLVPLGVIALALALFFGARAWKKKKQQQEWNAAAAGDQSTVDHQQTGGAPGSSSGPQTTQTTGQHIATSPFGDEYSSSGGHTQLPMSVEHSQPRVGVDHGLGLGPGGERPMSDASAVAY